MDRDKAEGLAKKMLHLTGLTVEHQAEAQALVRDVRELLATYVPDADAIAVRTGGGAAAILVADAERLFVIVRVDAGRSLSTARMDRLSLALEESTETESTGAEVWARRWSISAPDEGLVPLTVETRVYVDDWAQAKPTKEERFMRVLAARLGWGVAKGDE